MKLSYLGVLTALTFAAPAVQAREVPSVLPTAADSDEIIVQALRIPRAKLPTQVNWAYDTALGARISYERSSQFMRCALRSPDASRLRAAVDGEPNGARARFAQGFLIVTQPACVPGIPNPMLSYNTPTTIIDYGTSLISRGAIYDVILQKYAPDASLTPAETQDPAIQSRYFAREGLRNRLRLPNDRDALVLVSCLVQRQPVLATRIVRADAGSALNRGLVQTMLVEGRECLGGSDSVTIEPINFRIYVLDAFYRWVVAARNVESLIPANDQS